jgi:predicted ATPase with chaperone activity
VAALQNSGYQVPPKRITVNLAPARATMHGVRSRHDSSR